MLNEETLVLQQRHTQRPILAQEALLLSDALTVNPFLGKDTLEPYLTEVKDNNRGLFILVKTSNPGSGDYQNVLVKDILFTNL